MDIQRLETRKIFQAAFILSLLISTYTIWQDDIMNANGYYYLRSAQLFIDNGLAASYGHVGWPFYSILTASLSYITGISLEYSALLINSIFFAAMTVFIGKIILELTTDRRVLLIAIALILAHPKINDSYRTYIIRDPGYWALYFASVLAFLRYWKRPELKHAAVWCCTIILATLFRSEGAVTFLLAPLLLFFKNDSSFKRRLQLFGKINLIPVILVISLLIIGTLSGTLDQKHLGKLSQLATWATEIIPNLHNEILDRAARLNDAVFYKYTYSHGYAVSIIVTTILLIFLTEVASSLTYIYLPFSLHAMTRRILPEDSGISAIVGFIAINTIIILVFLSKYYFITGRYAITLALLLLIFASFSMAHLYGRWQQQKTTSAQWRWGGRIFIFIFSLTALDGVISTSPSKAFVRQAGYWMQNNMPETAKVYTNNPVILYYSGRIREDFKKYSIATENRFINILKHSNQHRYIALQIDKKDRELNQWLSNWKETAPIKEFKNSRGDRVVIFFNSGQRNKLLPPR